MWILIPLDMPLSELPYEFERTHHHGFAVVNDEGGLVGVVTIQDFDRAVEAGIDEGMTVADIATIESLIVAYDDEPMWSALRKLGVRDIGRVPVVKRGNEKQLVGIIRRKDIIQAYNLAIIKRSQHQYRADIERLGKLIDFEFIHVTIPQNATVVGHQISEIELPEECLIVSIHRGRKLYIAHGYTTLQAQDQLTVFVQEGCVPEVRKIFTQELERDGPMEFSRRANMNTTYRVG